MIWLALAVLHNPNKGLRWFLFAFGLHFICASFHLNSSIAIVPNSRWGGVLDINEFWKEACGMLIAVSYNSASVLHVAKVYSSWFVCVSVYLYVCDSDFTNVAKNQALSNAIKAHHVNILNLLVFDFEWRLCSLIMVWFAHLEHHCGTFQTPQKTNFLATSNLDYYKRYSCWQQNYTVNKLS